MNDMNATKFEARRELRDRALIAVPKANYGAARHASGFTHLAVSNGNANNEITSDFGPGSCYGLPTVQAGKPMTVKRTGWRCFGHASFRMDTW